MKIFLFTVILKICLLVGQVCKTLQPSCSVVFLNNLTIVRVTSAEPGEGRIAWKPCLIFDQGSCHSTHSVSSFGEDPVGYNIHFFPDTLAKASENGKLNHTWNPVIISLYILVECIIKYLSSLLSFYIMKEQNQNTSTNTPWFQQWPRE